jgi:hypothetical protein
LINEEIGKGNYTHLVVREDENKKVLLAKIRDGKSLFRMALNELPALTLLNQKEEYEEFAELEAPGPELSIENKTMEVSESKLIANVYPNPVVDLVTIKLNNSENSLVKIIGMNGQLMKMEEQNGNSFEMDLSELETGNYILEVTSVSNSNAGTKKVERLTLVKN